MDNTIAGGILDHHHHHHPPPAPDPIDSDRQIAALFDPHLKQTLSANSDDEDQLNAAGDDISAAGDDISGAGRIKRGSPWQRMKWTDGVVRLLIQLVAHVGDHDDVVEGFDGPRRKHGGSALQKKGKWKTVSKLMLEKGCYVSPQQCEDKFNDLNKRYKRLNEILGRGTTCQVVENPLLLDSLSNISPKAKDDVRKILSSKHLFYREMCAYHNGQRIPNCQDSDLHGCGPSGVVVMKDGNENANEDDDDDDDEEEDRGEEEDKEEIGKRDLESLVAEIDGMIGDQSKSTWEQKQWFKRRTLELQEERMEIDVEALELQKRHFKWQRFCSKKDRELERLRLENERLMMENQQMVMMVRQKELELEISRSGGPSDPSGFNRGANQMREQMDLTR